MRADETLLLTLGQPQGVEEIPGLPGFGAGQRQAGPARSTVARLGSELTRSMPGRWYGYDAAEAVVVDTNDREVMAALDASRGQALVEWVRRGGHLVVAVGGRLAGGPRQRARPDPARPCPPARSGSATWRPSITFAGATKPIAPAERAAGLGHEARGDRGAGRQGARSAPARCPAGRPRRLRVRPGDGRRVRRRPAAVLRLAPTGRCSGSRRSTSAAREADLSNAGNQRMVVGKRAADLPVGRHRPGDPAPPGPRAVPGRQARPVRLGRLLHLPLHPPDRAGRLLLPQEGPQADGADLDHLPRRSS